MLELLLSLGALIGGLICLSNKQSLSRALLIGLVVGVNLVLLGFFVLASNLSGNGIDESVLYHMMVGITGAGFDQFSAEIIFSIVWVVLSLTIAGGVGVSFYQSDQSASLSKRLLGVAALILATGFNPTFIGILKLADPIPNKTQPEQYLSQPSIGQFGVKKNVVYVYLESLERGYLDEENFPGLMPNLKKLESEALFFSQISQPIGTSWTIAGMVASQCGTPLIVSGEQNSMSGVDDFLPSVHCVGDELAEQGYQLTFMGGARLEFGGKGDFYQSHSFQKISGYEALKPQLPDPAYVSGWGLYDDSLLDLARDEFVALKTLDQPFGLFLLTLDTHQPDGYVNQQCGDLQYGDGSIPILNAVHCSDRLIADFVRDIQSLDESNETIVVVASDHLAMPGEATDKMKQKPRRNLWLVLGAEIAPGDVSVEGTSFDLAPTLLSLLGAESAAMGFGRNLLEGINEPTSERGYSKETVDELITKHRAYFNSLWEFPQIKQGIVADLESQQLKVADDRYIEFPSVLLLDDSLEVQDVLFSRYGRQTLLYLVRGFELGQKFFWVDECRYMTWLQPHELEGYAQNVCWAYGSLGAQSIEVAVVKDNGRLSAEQIQSHFRESTLNRSIMWSRLKVLSEQIAAKQLPAH